VTLAGGCVVVPASAAPDPDPVVASAVRIETKALAEQPFLSNPKLSPDGLLVAADINVSGKEVLGILSMTGAEPLLVGVPAKTDLRWYRWAGNGVLLISIGKTVPWDGDEALQTRLIAYDVATQTPHFLGGKEEGLTGDDVLWVDPEGNSLLLSYQRTIYEYPTVSSIDIATNRQKTVVGARDGVWDWYADDKGVVRAGFGFTNQRWWMMYRAADGQPFKQVVKARYDDDDAGFDAFRIYQGSDEGFRILKNEATGRYALYKYNFATRTAGDLVYQNATNDIDDFDTSDDGRSVTAVWYTDDRPRVTWFDTVQKETQDLIDKAVGGRHVSIVSRSRDHSVMIVQLGASNDPGRFYIYRPDTGVMNMFARVNEKLASRDLTPTRYVSYTARDGLKIPAYLTLPAAKEPRNLPLIILPHGGPYDVRDDGTYDPEVQFLANRGYAVLQPEYRGSGGFGQPFYQKGEGQWGRAMQDDLDDGMDWLVKEGTVDPKRVCLVGASYGGYAALWGATRNPERYRCAASFAGISDLPRQLKFQIDFKISKRYRKDWRQQVQGEDTFDLKTVSPLFTLNKLKVPILLFHGDDDQRVPYKQSRLYAEALKVAGKDVEFVTLKGEGHGFSTSANMQLWLDRLDAFLAKYNPGEIRQAAR
jgi:dipeptidyl aminopeptidase/acylaminoacyl peptidase